MDVVPCGFIVTGEQLASPTIFHLCFPLLIILTQTSIFDVPGILLPPLNVIIKLSRFYISVFLFYLGFLSDSFRAQRTAGEGGRYLFNSFLPLPPALQTLRHQPGNYCRELISAHSQQPDSNREPLVSERKSLTTKLTIKS